MSQNLLKVLQGCLNPATIQQSQQALAEFSESPTFIQELLQLIPQQEHSLLVFILSTLKIFLTNHYNHQTKPINEHQKNFLRSNLFNMFYVIEHDQQAINMYKKILYIVIAVDYPWPELEQSLEQELNGSILAAVYFFRQVSKVYEWFTGENQRSILQKFIMQYFPIIQTIVQKVLSNFNSQTAQALNQILKMFYSCFHIEIPIYLRDFNNIDRWMLYFQTIMQAPVPENQPNQKLVSRIYNKFTSVYTNDSQDGKKYKGWAALFRQRYAQTLLQQAKSLIMNYNGPEETYSLILQVMYNICKNSKLKHLLKQEDCHVILYQYILPKMVTNQQDLNYFFKEELEYIRRQDDLNCHPIRRSGNDLIQAIFGHCSFGSKSQIIKFMEHSAMVFESYETNDRYKQVIIRVLTKQSKLILKNKFIREQFEPLIIKYFLPILKGDHLLLNFEICQLLTGYLNHVSLSESTVSQLMAAIYQLLLNKSLAVKYSAILAFTALLSHRSALQATKVHFQQILEIYVRMLESLDHENLLNCLQTIVKNFSNQIVSFAPDLINHLVNMFCSMTKNKQDGEDNDDNEDANNQAIAALSTIKQILHSPLSQQTYLSISSSLLQMVHHIFLELDDYFQQILSLFNVLIYKADTIADFQFPYIVCRKLLEGNNQVLNNCTLSVKDIQLVSKAECPDEQYEQTLVSILKNLIKKMPDCILHRVVYPRKPQLILALIENKRLDNNSLSTLNTTDIDDNWAKILQSYSYIVMGVGMVCDSFNLKIITGLSLYPWIQEAFNAETVKRTLFFIDENDDEDEDDMLQENTMQLLEKYAKEDDDEDEDYYIQTGINYSYLYDSPFDSSRDKQLLLNCLRNLSPNEAQTLMQNLNPRYRSKLENLTN